jgi:hypothetical protein
MQRDLPFASKKHPMETELVSGVGTGESIKSVLTSRTGKCASNRPSC